MHCADKARVIRAYHMVNLSRVALIFYRQARQGFFQGAGVFHIILRRGIPSGRGDHLIVLYLALGTHGGQIVKEMRRTVGIVKCFESQFLR